MKEILRLCLVLTVIAVISAGVLAYVSQKTAEPIERSLREEKMSAVRQVLPPFDNEPDKDTVTIATEEGEIACYRGTKDGVVVGAAFSVTAPNGYSGPIELMVGVDTAGVVQGIKVLRHLETPGLGAKIETEQFESNYKGKSLTNPAVWDVVKDGGTFKQITGATISSRAVTHAVARGLEFFAAHRSEILGAPVAPADSGAAQPGGEGAGAVPDEESAGQAGRGDSMTTTVPARTRGGTHEE
jgi:electron transport complex protein RnfG